MVHERAEAYAEAYAGVDVSKGRLEVCVRRGRERGKASTPLASPTTPPA
jgi:hypothetical protein